MTTKRYIQRFVHTEQQLRDMNVLRNEFARGWITFEQYHLALYEFYAV